MLVVAVIMMALAAAPALAFDPQPDPSVYLPGVEKVAR
jgi:hypothetical protein